MQKQQVEEQNDPRQGGEPNNLSKQKDYLVNLLLNAVEEQRQSDRIQRNISFHTDDLNEAIDFISKLWKYNQQLQEENSAMRNNSQLNDPYSSIIVQQDNSQSQVQQLGSNQFIVENKEQEYTNEVYEKEKQKVQDYIQEINKKLIWLDNVIKKGSSVVSNKLSDHSKFSEEEYNLAQEQFKEDNQSNASIDEKIKRGCTIEDLKGIQVLYKMIVPTLEEHQLLKKEIMDCETEIKELKKKISDQLAIINNLQKLKRNKNQDGSTEYKVKPNKNSKDQQENNADYIFQSIRKEYDEISKISQIAEIKKDSITEKADEKKKNNNQIEQEEVTLPLANMNQIQKSTQKIVEQAEKLQKQVNDNEAYVGMFQKIVCDYQVFLLMCIVEKKSLQQTKLPLDAIQKMWDGLNIPNNNQNTEIIKVLKYQQKSYFLKENYDDPEQFWPSLNERFQNLLFQINILLGNFIKIQQDTLKQLKISKKKRLVKKTKEQQWGHLQYIESQIEEEGLSLIKNNIQIIIAQLN